MSDLADFLNIDSPDGYKNFVEELFSVIVFFSPRNLEILIFSLFFFSKKVTYSIETTKFSKPKFKNWLEPVGGQVFELQFLFLKSSKILIFDEVLGTFAWKLFISKFLQIYKFSHNFWRKLSKYPFSSFFCSLGKKIERRILQRRIVRRRILRWRTFRSRDKITSVKNYPTKSSPSEELSDEESSGRRILRRRMFRLPEFFFWSEEFSGEKSSCEESCGEEYSANRSK
jgi:hypothetical protein